MWYLSATAVFSFPFDRPILLWLIQLEIILGSSFLGCLLIRLRLLRQLLNQHLLRQLSKHRCDLYVIFGTRSHCPRKPTLLRETFQSFLSLKFFQLLIVLFHFVYNVDFVSTKESWNRCALYNIFDLCFPLSANLYGFSVGKVSHKDGAWGIATKSPINAAKIRVHSD